MSNLKGIIDKIQDKNTLSVNVMFLDGCEKKFPVKSNWKGCTLLAAVNSYLNLYEPEFFGLKFVHDGEDVVWLEPDKLFRKQWYSVKHNADDDTEPLMKFRVKIYPIDPSIYFPRTRHYFYLQLKRNIYKGKLPCSVKQSIQLGSYIAQIELGDYMKEERKPGYLDEYELSPGQNEEFERRVADLHKLHRGLKVRDAELKYLNTAKRIEMYGIIFYKAKDEQNTEIQIGVRLCGILFYNNDMVLQNTFTWCDMLKAVYKGTNFSIKVKNKPDESASQQSPTIKFSMCSCAYGKSFWKALMHHYAFSRGEKPGELEQTVRDKITTKISRSKCQRYSSQPLDAALTHIEPETKDPSDKIFHSSLKLLRDGLENGSIYQQFRQVHRKNYKFPITIAKCPENMEKNYRQQILPYDCNRVVLPEDVCEYINASHINMQLCGQKIKHYIAAQGPMANTVVDFWRMVQYENVNIIVMLTAVIENGIHKCHEYFPEADEELEISPGLSVLCTVVQPNETGSYAFRELILIDENATQVERIIHHMQFLGWPNTEPPGDPHLFVQFRNRVEDTRRTTNPAELNSKISTTLVHCSAGISRTGVFILVDTALALMEDYEPVYPTDLLEVMRNQRAGFVLKADLFRFACDCIIDKYQQIMDEDRTC